MSTAFRCDRCREYSEGSPELRMTLGDLCPACTRSFREWWGGEWAAPQQQAAEPSLAPLVFRNLPGEPPAMVGAAPFARPTLFGEAADPTFDEEGR